MSDYRTIRRTVCTTFIQAVATMLGVVVLNFFLLKLAPGDAADVLAAESGAATTETMTALRARFGLDDPLPSQLGAYLNNLVHLSLGYSPRYGMPVAELIGQRLPGTLALMLCALVIALASGSFLGSLMATFSGRLVDRVVSIATLLSYSIPGFWISLILILIFSVELGWLPSGGDHTIGAQLNGLPALLDKARHMTLPVISLALFYLAVYARLTRASMLKIKSQDFVRTARAKGLSPLRVTTRHVMRNALIPVTTIAGVHVGGMLGATVVIETVYSWPGLGRLALEALMARDFSVLLGILLVSSFLVVAANATVDLLQTRIDPRIGASR